MSKVQRTDIYRKYGGRCAYCGRIISLEDMQIDHLVPKYRTLSDADLRELGKQRGGDDIDNLMPACRPCNYRKGALSLENFRNALQRGQICCRRDFTYRMMVRYGLVVEMPPEVVFYFEKSGRRTR